MLIILQNGLRNGGVISTQETTGHHQSTIVSELSDKLSPKQGFILSRVRLHSSILPWISVSVFCQIILMFTVWMALEWTWDFILQWLNDVLLWHPLIDENRVMSIQKTSTCPSVGICARKTWSTSFIFL